ncbi:CoA transferase [Aeromicrobium sp. PE09-221]|uniref:CaiB/BaiF CoA transferase family protein n=1 Tax=Aeromicrobium sp. PE09-221 TaxID=1898043 RepID=UPI000B3E4DE2|nr:CoA transferase [Aeromicrobium sp. PE09-221]OUZ12288.1 CoA transferase [Aeromicrobium sp. PE09-221]
MRELDDLLDALRDQGTGPGALDGVVVLDITRVVAGPFCSMVLADLGATVVKIEHPDDPDYTREFPPHLDVPDGEDPVSGFFAQYNRNKLGLTLNLGHEEGRRVLKSLAARADVLVENFRAGTMDKLGIGWDVLREVNPRLVYTALSGYGQTGPYRRRPAYDNSAQATGGLWSMNGEQGRPPVRVGTIIGDLSASLYGVIGTLAALRHAEASGRGQLVDISQQDSVLSLTENAVVSYTVDGKVPEPMGNQHPFVRPYELFPCRDGYVFFGGYTDKFWRISCELFGTPEVVENESIDTMAKRFVPEVYESIVRPIVNSWFEHRTKAELEELADDLVPLSAVKDIAEAVADPQIAAREMVVDVDYPGHGPLRMFGNPVRLSATPARPVARAPRLSEHTTEILSRIAGLDQETIDKLRADGTIR